MNKERFLERKQELSSAIDRLREALEQQETALIRDAIIRRFGFTYELGWKTIKLFLESKDIDVRNAKDTLEEALKQGVIEDGNLWSELHKNRKLTSHTYDEAGAIRIYDFVKQHALALFTKLLNNLEALTSTWR